MDATAPLPSLSLEEQRRTMDFVLAALAAAVRDSLPDRPGPSPADVDWSLVLHIARRGKLFSPLSRGLNVLGLEPAREFKCAASEYQRATLQINASNLSTISRVATALHEASVPFIIFKGPLQQQVIHNTHFVRPAGDVDVLTSDGDFNRARSTLNGIGYSLPMECASPWWRHFLGEQHLFNENSRYVTVDLHHRTQQPGCPSSRHPLDYFKHVDDISLGRQKVPTFSLVEASLISAISLVKAIFHREPAALYAVDLTVALGKMNAHEQHRLAMLAQRQGLFNTLLLSLRVAERLFGSVTGVIKPRAARSSVDESLAAIVLTPWDEGIRWPKRRQLLWELCDPSLIGGRPGTYLVESLWALTSELCRTTYQRSTTDGLLPA